MPCVVPLLVRHEGRVQPLPAAGVHSQLCTSMPPLVPPTRPQQLRPPGPLTLLPCARHCAVTPSISNPNTVSHQLQVEQQAARCEELQALVADLQTQLAAAQASCCYHGEQQPWS